MAPKLTDEMRQALQEKPHGPVEIPDDQSHRVYVLIDAELHQQAMAALRQKEDHDAIARGIAQMEAGEGKPLNAALEHLRGTLGFPEQG